MEKTNTILDNFLKQEYVALKGENDKVIQFRIIGGLRYNNKYYGILTPTKNIDGFIKNEGVIFEMEYNKNNDVQYTMITDDNLKKSVFNRYMEFYNKAMEKENSK